MIADGVQRYLQGIPQALIMFGIKLLLTSTQTIMMLMYQNQQWKSRSGISVGAARGGAAARHLSLRILCFLGKTGGDT